jgi:hypothetical protein
VEIAAAFFPSELTVSILPFFQRLTVEIVVMIQELEGAMPLVNRLAGERFTELKGKFFKRLPRRLDNLEAALEVQHTQTQDKNSLWVLGFGFWVYG